MFGFAILDKKLLSPEQQGFLNLSYCGLCHQLRNQFGLPAGLALSHDTLLLVLLVATQKPDINLLGRHTRCPATGFLRMKAALGEEGALDYACAITMLLLDEKLKDNQRDGKSIPSHIARLVARPYIDHAYTILDALNFPINVISDTRTRQAQIESAVQKQTIEVQLNPTGTIVGQAFAHTAQIAFELENHGPLYELGRSIGRIVALADACEDLKADRQHRVYNPLVEASPAGARSHIPVSVLREACYAFACEFKRIRKCLADLRFARFPELIDNVISKGIPYRTKQSLYRLWVDNHWEGDVPEVLSASDKFRHCPKCGKPHLPAKGTWLYRPSSKKCESSKNLWLLGTLVSDANETSPSLGFRNPKDYLVACALSALS